MSDTPNIVSDTPNIVSNQADSPVLIAIDWADKKHFWALRPVEGAPVERGELENKPEAIAHWAIDLRERFPGRPIFVALEQSRGAVASMLQKYPHLQLYPVLPTLLASYRKAFFPSGAKSDPNDTNLILEVLASHRDRLRPWKPDTIETRLLQSLVEDRRQAVDEKTRQVLRLIDCLKQYFPQVLEWFGKVDTPLVGALLENWGDLQQLQQAHPGTLRKFFQKQNCRGEKLMQERIDAIYVAVSAVDDAALREAGTCKARGLVKFIAVLREHIAKLDARIAELTAVHPDAALFNTLPSAGPVMVPRLIVAFGTDRDRFASALELLSYSGIAPVKVASGNSQRISFRRACAKFIRQTFHEWAGLSIRDCEWARAYYDAQRDKGKSHHQAVRSLAFKWVRILFRCWQSHRPYDEQIYMQSLRRRGSSLGANVAQSTQGDSSRAHAPKATNVGWNKVAGFSKLSEFLS